MNELYTFTSEERSLLKTISEAYYMSPVLARINNIFNDLTPDKYPDAFDCLHDIILDANTEVQKILERRKLDGLIADIKQASKAVVGNIFPYSLIYIFLKNKEIKNIDRHIYITNKKSSIRGFDEISTIQLGDGERQKPDCDLIIYSYGKNLEEDKCRGTTNIQESYPKCIILSLKTSLRERAAQTYKWKLLLEIASDSGSKIREKYGITYNISEIPLIRFVTINFYNEINSPQQRGMFKFFDKAFLAKRLNRHIEKKLSQINNEENTQLVDKRSKEFISPLSELVDFVNQFFKL